MGETGGNIIARLRKLGTNCRRVTSFTSQPLYSWETRFCRGGCLAPGPFWSLRKGEKFLTTAGNRTMILLSFIPWYGHYTNQNSRLPHLPKENTKTEEGKTPLSRVFLKMFVWPRCGSHFRWHLRFVPELPNTGPYRLHIYFYMIQ